VIINNLCQICLTNSLLNLDYEVPTFRHLDFTTVAKSFRLLKCTNCQAVYNSDAAKSERFIFETKKYAHSRQTKQTVSIDEFTKPLTRSFLQAEILTQNFISKDTQQILDIGCFDGSLLKEINDMNSKLEFHGFDVNRHLETVFPNENNFHFISKDLKNLEIEFDLIILSHSILYINDLPELMLFIRRALKDDGILFIQVPDISINPYYSLMGDQSYIFTEISLTNVLQKFGFITQILSNEHFPRELLLSAQNGKSINCKTYKEEDLFEQNIGKIKDLKIKLENMNNHNLTVLGTTVNAAFVDEILKNKTLFFVDENLFSLGKKFRDKDVKHPNELKEKNHTILPYGEGETGMIIKRKFENFFQGTFSLI